MNLLQTLLTLALVWCMGSAARAADMPAVEELVVSQAGFAARYYPPHPRSAQGAAVLMLGGSDGGYPSRRAAADLAESGHPVLALAYAGGFAGKIDGLPDRLENIPLEYMFGALDWLRARAGPKRAVAIMGESRGAELALIVASRRADVAAVIAFSPSSVAWPAVGDMTGRIPAWTEKGRPVPYVALATTDPTQQFTDGLRHPVQASAAAIPVERAKAAVLLVSSRADRIWPAAQMADQIEARLRAAHYQHPLVNLQFDDASHLLMGPGPGVVSFTSGTFTVHFGGTEEGTLRARQAAWSAAEQLLRNLRPRRATD